MAKINSKTGRLSDFLILLFIILGIVLIIIQFYLNVSNEMNDPLSMTRSIFKTPESAQKMVSTAYFNGIRLLF